MEPAITQHERIRRLRRFLRCPERLFSGWLLLLTITLAAGCDTPPRPRVPPVRVNLRSLAIAVEAYRVDHGIYPAWGIANKGPGGTQTYNYWFCMTQRHSDDPASLPCFLLNGPMAGQKFMTLTTPIAYITAYPSDPFAPVRRTTFLYWSINPGETDPSGKIVGTETAYGWILVSAGPDRDYDLAGKYEAYDPRMGDKSPFLLWLAYDPTNGTVSNGDIWRVRQ